MKGFNKNKNKPPIRLRAHSFQLDSTTLVIIFGTTYLGEVIHVEEDETRDEDRSWNNLSQKMPRQISNCSQLHQCKTPKVKVRIVGMFNLTTFIQTLMYTLIHKNPKALYTKTSSLFATPTKKSSSYHPTTKRLRPWSHQTFRLVLAVKFMGITLRNKCWPPPLFTLVQPEMPTYGASNGRCDQPLTIANNRRHYLTCIPIPWTLEDGDVKL